MSSKSSNKTGKKQSLYQKVKNKLFARKQISSDSVDKSNSDVEPINRSVVGRNRSRRLRKALLSRKHADCSVRRYMTKKRQTKRKRIEAYQATPLMCGHPRSGVRWSRQLNRFMCVRCGVK
jgi:hypothetical protein